MESKVTRGSFYSIYDYCSLPIVMVGDIDVDVRLIKPLHAQ